MTWCSTSTIAPDIDECLTNNGQCSQVCVNEVGTYRCACSAGYTLGGDGRMCTGMPTTLLMMLGLWWIPYHDLRCQWMHYQQWRLHAIMHQYDWKLSLFLQCWLLFEFWQWIMHWYVTIEQKTMNKSIFLKYFLSVLQVHAYITELVKSLLGSDLTNPNWEEIYQSHVFKMTCHILLHNKLSLPIRYWWVPN